MLNIIVLNVIKTISLIFKTKNNNQLIPKIIKLMRINKIILMRLLLSLEFSINQLRLLLILITTIAQIISTTKIIKNNLLITQENLKQQTMFPKKWGKNYFKVGPCFNNHAKVFILIKFSV